MYCNGATVHYSTVIATTICDRPCGDPVAQRDDETEEAISNRLEVYNQKTASLVGFYEKEGMLLTVVATSSDDVINTIKKKIGI